MTIEASGTATFRYISHFKRVSRTRSTVTHKSYRMKKGRSISFKRTVTQDYDRMNVSGPALKLLHDVH